MTVEMQKLCHFVAQPYSGKVTKAFRIVPCGSEMAVKNRPGGNFTPLGRGRVNNLEVLPHFHQVIIMLLLSNYIVDHLRPPTKSLRNIISTKLTGMAS